MINTDERIFYLSGEITEENISEMCFNILYLLALDDIDEAVMKDFVRRPINLYIQSNGGCVGDAWALVDIIQNSKTPIYTYACGYVHSAALTIYLAGHKRFASRHSTFLYHSIYCSRAGKYQDLVEDRNEMDYIHQEVENFVIENTSISKDKLQEVKNKKQDWFIHLEEALALGIVTDQF